MARVVVDVMLKAVHGALPRLGFSGVTDVRQGKRFELEVETADEATLAEIEKMAETLLANTVIDDFFVRVEDEASAK